MRQAEPERHSAYGSDIALLATLAVLWGASYTFIKLGVETIPPVTLIAARTVIAGCLLVVVMRASGLELPRDARTWRRLFVQACLNSVLPFTLIAWAERTVDAGLATILNSTPPIFTFLITWAIVRHEPVTSRKLFGAVTGLAGILLIIGPQAFVGLGDELLAQLAILVASVSYACAAIFGRTFADTKPIAVAAGSLLCGAAVLIPASIVIDQPWALRPSWTSILALLALSVFSTALAFVIYFRLLRTLGSIGTTAQAYLRVPIGVAIGIAFLGESLTTSAWLGLACVVAAVAAMTLPSRRHEA
jgi:drug/metabolite transporter (DMT)-like permease